MKKINYYNTIVKTLQEIKKDYPNLSLGQHIATCTQDYPNLYFLSDKEFLFTLEKYKAELDLNTVPEFDVNKVYSEGCNLDSILEQEEEEDY